MLIKNGIAEDMMVYVDYRLYRTIFKSSEIYYYELKSTIGASLVPQYRRRGFDPWVGKIPWRRKWQPNLVLLPGKSHGQRSLEGYSPRSCRRVGPDLVTITTATTTNTIGLEVGVQQTPTCLCCYSVSQSCLTLCDLMGCSTAGFPVLHHLPELAQTECPLSW